MAKEKTVNKYLRIFTFRDIFEENRQLKLKISELETSQGLSRSINESFEVTKNASLKKLLNVTTLKDIAEENRILKIKFSELEKSRDMQKSKEMTKFLDETQRTNGKDLTNSPNESEISPFQSCIRSLDDHDLAMALSFLDKAIRIDKAAIDFQRLHNHFPKTYKIETRSESELEMKTQLVKLGVNSRCILIVPFAIYFTSQGDIDGLASNLNAKILKGCSIFSVAIAAGYEGIVEALWKIMNGVVSEPLESIYTPLSLSAFHGRLELVKMFLENSENTVQSVDQAKQASKNHGFGSISHYIDQFERNIRQVVLRKLTILRHQDSLRQLRTSSYGIQEIRDAEMSKCNALSVNQSRVESQYLHHEHTILKATIDDERVINGWSALHIACYEGDLDQIIRLLDANVSVDELTKDGSSPLMLACWNGKLSAIQMLHARHASLNIKNTSMGWTALHLASYKGYSEIVSFLVQNQASINERANDGATPLILASWKRKLDVVRVLIAHQANLNSNNWSMGWAAIHSAAYRGSVEVVRCLIDHGAIIDESAHDGATPLMLACCTGSLDVAQLLIKKGANLNKQSSNGTTVLEYASLNNQQPTVEFLKKFTATQPTQQALIQLDDDLGVAVSHSMNSF